MLNEFFNGAAPGSVADYTIERSLRFNSADSSYLSRTPSSEGNRKTWTWSGWVKRCKFGERFRLLAAGPDNSNRLLIGFGPDDKLEIFSNTSGVTRANIETNAVFRDPSSWYHVVFKYDAANTTAAIYVNGVNQDLTVTTAVANVDQSVNSTSAHYLARTVDGTFYSNGYLADVHFIDGQALAASDFGEYDDNGVWQPKAYTFGTNPNNGTTWSNNTTGTAAGTRPFTAAFDGNLSSWFQSAGGLATINFSGLPTITSLEIYAGITTTSDNQFLYVNGVDKSSLFGASAAWVTVPGITSLTSIASNSRSGIGVGFIHAIKVNGYVLIDGAGDNSFHLDFSDNSSNAALGDDSSGNNNDWTVNNISVDAGNYAKYPGAITSSDGAFYSSSNPANLFSSGTNFFGGYNAGTGNSSFVWTPPGGESVTNPKITVEYFTAIKINGTTYATSGGSSGSSEQTLSFTGTLNTLTVENTSGNAFVVRAYGLKPDGTNLVTLSSGAGNDSLIDTPTNYEASSGNNGGNYATLNPLQLGANITLSNGNLDGSQPSGTGTNTGVTGTIGLSSGKWYWETTVNTRPSGTYTAIGIASSSWRQSSGLASSDPVWIYYGDGTKLGNGSGTTYGASYGVGDVIGVAFDADNGSLTFYKNGASQGTAFTSLTSGPYFPIFGKNQGACSWTWSCNFGQRPFAYPPGTSGGPSSDYKSLCTQNLPAPTIADGSTAMDALLFTGNGGSQTLSGLGFSPDFTWFKARSFGFSHELLDIVRGGTKVLFSDLTNAESTNSSLVTSFNSDGVSIGSALGANGSSRSSVLWAWDAGTTTVSNTDGSITSSVRANPSAGFSIINHVGTGAAGTFGHGLNAAPEFLIFKNRDATDNWFVWFKAADGTATTGGALNSANAFFTGSANELNSTLPTSSVINVGSNLATNGNTQDIITYAFAPVEGYSAFGSYQGNGSSDGPMVYTGFRPRWILIKRTQNADGWLMLDAARNPYNVADLRIEASSGGAETNSATIDVRTDFLSNGFKLRGNWGGFNQNNETFVYACFAEHPLKYARAR